MYKLLIVDDEWAHRYEIKKFLRDYGEVFLIESEAEDGQEALQLFITKAYDAVFADIRMPVFDGITLLKELHKINSDLPVILVSTHSDFEYAKKGIEYSAFDYIVKPLEKERFFNVLNKLKLHLDKQSAEKTIKINIEKALSEKIDFGLKEKYENNLYILMLSNSEELDKYINILIADHLSVFENDYFKLEIAFAKLIEDLEEKLFKSFSFAQKYYFTSNSSFGNKKLNTIDKIKNELGKISEFIQMFHLGQSDAIVQKLCEYALTKSNGRASLDEASELLNYNSDYLGKLFKLKTGESFIQFSAKIKLEYAKKLLQSNAYKNFEISEMLGYKNTDYFGKLFKDYTGMTPSEYKKTFN